MFTIGVDQSLTNIALCEHRCLNNIKKLYKSAGKCDKVILESAMVSIPEGFTDNSSMSYSPSVNDKKS